MNAFRQAQNVEAQGRERIDRELRRFGDGNVVWTDKGTNARGMQADIGDAVANIGGVMYGFECKVEAENKYGNFFFETWSNKKTQKPGWLNKWRIAAKNELCRPDFLWYFFLNEDCFYHIPVTDLLNWCNDGHIHRYEPRKQNKYDQLNETWGRCVPIDVVLAEVAGAKRMDTLVFE